ncbi:translation initiation factor IF-2 [Plasmodium gonderi]|uniref:Translation initiation factor IF-2 n=1 Tax=Plasmodium gonderi TaxID=77519 RepID=A0A1Y1JE87_PLAGO|nr:translation initiation factor IF-2 [Plasmodium gonderi]GAW79635.1 translation initiation factor IF-2 [Plasmodium gonderi]
MKKMNMKKFEDPNFWIYENVLRNVAKNASFKITKSELRRKAGEKLNEIIEASKEFDKELKEINYQKCIPLCNPHQGRKVDVNKLPVNPFNERNKLIDLKQFLSKGSTGNVGIVSGMKNNRIQKGNIVKKNVLQKMEEKNVIKRNMIFTNIKKTKTEEIFKITSFFNEHANYYDTHLKEKYMNVFLNSLQEKGKNNLIEEDYYDSSPVLNIHKSNIIEKNYEQNPCISIASKHQLVANPQDSILHTLPCNKLVKNRTDASQRSSVDFRINDNNRSDNNVDNNNSLNDEVEIPFTYNKMFFKFDNRVHSYGNSTKYVEKAIRHEPREGYDLVQENFFQLRNCDTSDEGKKCVPLNKNFGMVEMNLNEDAVEYVNSDEHWDMLNLCDKSHHGSGELFDKKVVDVPPSIRGTTNFFANHSEYHAKNLDINLASSIRKIPNEKVISVDKSKSKGSKLEETLIQDKRKRTIKEKLHEMNNDGNPTSTNCSISNKINSFNIFEKMNKTSLYCDIQQSHDEGIGKTDTILSILQNLKEKKKNSHVTSTGFIGCDSVLFSRNGKNGTEESSTSVTSGVVSENGNIILGKGSDNKNANVETEAEEADEEEGLLARDASVAQAKLQSEGNDKNVAQVSRNKKIMNKGRGEPPLHEQEYIDSNNITVYSLSQHVCIEEEKIINLCKFILDNEYITKYTKLEKEVAELICEELGILNRLKYSNVNLKKRNPVVTILGHVDHGKTTLLDRFRNSNIAQNEIGGITQKLGAFEVLDKETNKKITFLDTPGHSVFKKIRQRCAQCTDLIILVISLDDGIMSETIECIQLAKKFNIPLIIAANKIDKFGSNLEKISKSLVAYDIITELEENGQVPIVPISAKENINIDKLQKCILHLSDSLNLMSDYGSLCSAYVLEKKIHPSKGKLLTVICKSGTLKVNSYILIGHVYTKIKQIYDCNDKLIKEAFPSEVVQIVSPISLSQDSNINYGDLIFEMSSLKSAQKIAKYKLKVEQYNLMNSYYEENQKGENKKEKKNKIMQPDGSSTCPRDIHLKSSTTEKQRENKITQDKTKNIKIVTENDVVTEIKLPQIQLIIKACDEGSIEAIIEGINEYNKKGKKEKYCDINNFIDRNYVKKNSLTGDIREDDKIFKKWEPFRIITKGVGSFNMNDLKYCNDMKPIFLIAFNIDIDRHIQYSIENNGAILRTHNIIYKLFEDIEHICNFYFDSLHLYEPVSKMVVNKTGYYTIKKNKTKKKRVLSVSIKEGSCNMKNYFTVSRNKNIIHKRLTVLSMQKNKQSTTELAKDCTINSIIFNTPSDDFEVGDEIVAYKKVDRAPLFNRVKTFDLSS